MINFVTSWTLTGDAVLNISDTVIIKYNVGEIQKYFMPWKRPLLTSRKKKSDHLVFIESN